MAKKIEYSILKNDKTKEQVTGELVNNIWGIDKRTVITGVQTMKDGTERTLSSSSYVITHIPTGAMLTSTRTLKMAKLLLQDPAFFEEPLNTKHMGEAISKLFNANGWNS